MSIHTFWGQLATQAISFILFFLILRWLAWKPVMQFLEERRQRIKDELDRVAELEEKTAQTQTQLERRLEKIEEEARERVQQAVTDGRKMAEEIAERARSEAQDIREHAREMAQIEYAKAMRQVKDDVVRMTIALSESLLREKMDDERHHEMVGRFLDELEKN